MAQQTIAAPLGGLLVSPLRKLKRRKCDGWGCGHFGASRAGGKRKHNGQDFLSKGGEKVFAPISGRVRVLYPYSDDPRFQGVEITEGQMSVKIFYFEPSVKTGDIVTAGDDIGRAQNLGIKYKGIPNHIHVEIRRGGVLRDPSPYFEQDFTESEA